MTPVERGWVAGIVEGEGCFVKGSKPCGRLRVAMTDLDVVQRLQDTTGIGLVHDRGRRQAHHKQVWDWTVLRRENMCNLATEIAPLLLQRRREAMSFIFRAADLSMPPATVPAAGSPDAWGWVAGLIEGEGWISPAPDAIRRQVNVNVESTDYDVIERLAELTGVGRICGIAHIKPGEKPRWAWRVNSRPGTQYVLDAIFPLLGQRRTARAAYALDVISSTSPRGERRSRPAAR
jgi:hypothetical protein